MQFRKKTNVIDAALFDGNLVGDPDGSGGVVAGTCPKWFQAVVPEIDPTFLKVGDVCALENKLYFCAPDGLKVAEPGDWIVRGDVGNIYPMRPGFFKENYEPA